MDEIMEIETPEEGTEGGVVTAETGAESGEPEGGKGQDVAEPAGQSREDNARFQAARKAGEAAGQRRTEERFRGALQKLGMTDPDSGETIDTVEGLTAYADKLRHARLKNESEKTGRSMAELEEEEDAKEVVRKQKRERAENEKREEETRRQREWVAADAADFSAKHPDVDLAKLDANARFRKFCGSRYGREPLAQLYEDWQEFAGEEAAAKAVGKAAEKDERSTGAGGGGVSDGLTAAQQRALDEWNREYPQMKMTAKEFLRR